ncbi:N-acetylmuramoyl-L-alanine amidase [Pseudomonas cavernae]|uniref:N-acetylmuramoyl-L-alanine amidase n=1 Tax=Pseudomonas cavernae TaxID=2320867 RepID=A0A385YZD4_9PSED|nr:N-acetylmuramoyl-L-alanine amidase [Pseudomonas cavernae]AYC30943.1 N-acetylmuramoyl-L-alanine amidase [Pseudomonas cavernae]
MKTPAFALILALLAGCAGGPQIDNSHPSASYDSRVQFVVLHYTSTDLQHSLQLLTHGELSSHYLIGAAPPTIYRLVDENQRAWHAGESEWQGRTWLNSSSIGIELVNPGYADSANGRVWYPYREEQIEALIVLLKDIVQRYRIAPENIVGHSDIAPQRKLDPGPLFPWQRLAAAGLGRWPEAGAVARAQARFAQAPPSAGWFQQQLRRLGYAVPQSGELDAPTRQVLAAFQMHYRPSRCDGQADAQTAALLSVLNGSPR